jgi:hypothetical protein
VRKAQPRTRSTRARRTSAGRPGRLVESFEPRWLLSGTTVAALADQVLRSTAVTHYTQRTMSSPDTYAGSSTPYGKSPTEVRSAYGLGPFGSDTLTFNGIEGDGQGQTIAIVDAFDDPDAAADLNAFSSTFGLPTLASNASLSTINSAAGPTFTKVSQTGSTTSLPGTDPAGPYSSTGGNSWEQEESLDIEWAHVMAPEANILLVECYSASDNNLIRGGAAWARAQPGVVDVSMSFGGNESSGSAAYDTYFTSPAGHTGGSATAGGTELSGGVTFLASAGDSGAYGAGTTVVQPQYPASSPEVVAVGGTTLNTTDDAYVSESAWGNSASSGTEGGGGGGISGYETQPSYQASTVSAFSTTNRTYPDVSILADPDTGVPIYDSWDFGASTPWVPGYEGGTSLASPMMAGLVAVADQDRAINGLGSLAGVSGTLANLYSISGSDYHDITTGNNGYAAGTGYDLATGRGSPVANKWVVDIAGIAGTPTVSGQVFQDNNANDTFDGTDVGLAGVTVYLDTNNDGVHESGEPIAVTGSNGQYTFTGAPVGSGTVRLLNVPTGFVAVAAAPSYTVTVTTSATANLGLFRTAYTDATAGDAYTIRASPTASTQLQILVNGTVAYTAPANLPPSLSFTFTGTADTAAIDFGNGDPVPSGGISVNGTAAGEGDTLSVLGTAGNDAISVNGSSVLFGTNTITYADMPNLSVEPRGGTDSLTVTGATVSLPAQAAGDGFLARSFSTLSVGAGGKVVVGTAAARSDRSVLVVTASGTLSIASTGQLDLGGNDLIVRGGTLSTIAGLVGTGYAAGAWTGVGGIASGAAAANTSHLTALGTILASAAANTSTFDGQPISATDVLVKYTYYGDTNLDGAVDIADYTRTDVGFITPGSGGWSNGDFNYDKAVDGSDYTLIDNAFNGQTTPL